MKHPALVGRSKELRQLLDGIGDEDSPRVYLISGDVGIGKTRLLSELAESIGKRMLTVWSERIESPSAPALYSWILAVRSYLARCDDADVEDSFRGLGSTLVDFVPELQRREQPRDLVPHRRSEASRFALYDEVTRFFQRAARKHPFVLLFDNLQLADQSSLELLEHFVQQITDFPIWVVACSRNTLDGEYPDFDRIIERIKRHRASQSIALDGLSRSEVRRLANEVAGQSLPPGVHDPLYNQSEGNPLFVVEAARVLQGRTDRRGFSDLVFDVPYSLKSVLLSRIGSLSDTAQHALKLASVLGRDFLRADLGGAYEIAARDLSAVVAEARRANIVSAPSRGTFRFQHALYREVLYDQLGETERQDLHARAAAYFRTRKSRSATFDLAYHYYEIADCGYAREACRFNLAASDISERNHAYSVAAMHLQRALDASLTSGDEDPEQQFNLHLKLGKLLFAAGKVDTSSIPLRTAARIAGAAQRWEDMAAAMRELQFVVGSNGTIDDEIIELHETLLHRIDPELRYDHILAQACYADARRLRGDYDAAILLATEAMDSAARLDGEDGVLQSFFYACWASGCVAIHPEQIAFRAQKYDRLIDFASRIEAKRELLQILASRLFDLFASNTAAHELDQALEQILRIATRSHDPHYLILARSLETCRDLLRGRWLDVVRGGIQLQQDALRWDVTGLSGAFSQQMFVVQSATGNLAALAPILNKIEADAEREGLWYPGQILLNCELGNLRAAQKLLRQYESFDTLPRDEVFLLSLIYLSEACLRLEDRTRLGQLFALLERFQHYCVTLPGTLAIGSVAGYMGAYAAALGKKKRAKTLFEEGLDANSRMDAEPWSARVKTDFAEFLLSGSDPQGHKRAKALMLDAQKTATRLRLNPLLARLATLEQHMGVGRLTPKEMSVLTLIAKGASNKQIADKLSVSQNTIATHVRHILQKLQVNNRVEAVDRARQAAWIE
ncbi:MAG: AAA family ATPase [Pseudomonadota bacterium]